MPPAVLEQQQAGTRAQRHRIPAGVGGDRHRRGAAVLAGLGGDLRVYAGLNTRRGAVTADLRGARVQASPCEGANAGTRFGTTFVALRGAGPITECRRRAHLCAGCVGERWVRWPDSLCRCEH